MIITYKKCIINFDNVREVYVRDDNNPTKGFFIRFLFDNEDYTTWEFSNEEDRKNAHRRILASFEKEWKVCDL